MAKGLRSKVRKFWATERRKTLGVPVEKKQLEEQAARLKASLDQQTNAESILKLKSVLNPWGVKQESDTASMDVAPVRRGRKPAAEKEVEKEEVEKEVSAVKMDVDKVVHRPAGQRTKGKKKLKGRDKKNAL